MPTAPGLDLPPVVVTPPPPSNLPVFPGDLPLGADALGFEPWLSLLAETVAHRGACMPLTLALFGAPGAGKSFALKRLAARIREISTAAASAATGPFLPAIHVQEIDAFVLEGDPALALAARIHAGLREPYPELARETGHAVRDPQVLLRETNEKLDESRRRLDAERRTLEESGSRLARLNETVLYESAGSQIDTYVRANRARIENRFNAFGIKGDPVRNFKDFVAMASAGSGWLGLVPRALFEFKGQMRLIVWAIVLVALGAGLDIAIEMKDSWLAALRSGPPFLMPAEVWLTGHIDLLALLRKAANWLACLLIAINLLRAFSFLRPVFAGIRLLQADLENRRRDLGSLYAHQTKRADLLAADVENLSRAAAEAERRAGGASAHGGLLDALPFDMSPGAQAQGFFTSLGLLLRGDRLKQAAPRRIVLVIDHLDSIAPERARALLATIHQTVASSGLAIITAADPANLQASRADLERWVQIPFSLDPAPGEDIEARHLNLVAQALGHEPVAAAAAKPDPAHSQLDEPLGDHEAALLAVLAPLAGAAPRPVKRLVNLYTLARAGSDAPKGLLALFLAVELGGTWAERQAAEALGLARPFEGETSPRWLKARAAAEAFDGHANPVAAAKAAARAHLFRVPA